MNALVQTWMQKVSGEKALGKMLIAKLKLAPRY